MMFMVGVGVVVVWIGWGVNVISGVVDFWVVVGFVVVVVIIFFVVVELVIVEFVNIVVVLDIDVIDVFGEGWVDVIIVVLLFWIWILEYV